MAIHVNENGTIKTAVADGISKVEAGIVNVSPSSAVDTTPSSLSTVAFYIILAIGSNVWGGSSAYSIFLSHCIDIISFAASSPWSVSIKSAPSNTSATPASYTWSGSSSPTAIITNKGTDLTTARAKLIYFAFGS
ncbi:MAG: hypothetical protein J6Y02_14690 [Pseudobutyrivibrio sp.]|nr:hypothetical protein [Pseudobutyrivibrio sp.]